MSLLTPGGREEDPVPFYLLFWTHLGRSFFYPECVVLGLVRVEHPLVLSDLPRRLPEVQSKTGLKLPHKPPTVLESRVEEVLLRHETTHVPRFRPVDQRRVDLVASGAVGGGRVLLHPRRDPV